MDRKGRNVVGVTNRPNSVPLDMSEGEDRYFADESGMHRTIGSMPVSVNKNRRMFTRIENVRTSLSDYHSPQESWKSPTGFYRVEALRNSVRDKIVRRQLNIRPLMKSITSPEGYISGTDLRSTLKALNLELSEEELEACCTSDGKVFAASFLKSLTVPDYEYGVYDPLGDSSKREVAWLSHIQNSWRERGNKATLKDNERHEQQQDITSDSSVNKKINSESSKWSRNELRRVFNITKNLEKVGVPLFAIVKDLRKGGDGNIKREDLERSLKRSSNFGMIKGQLDDLWGNADAQGAKTVNFLDLEDAIRAMESKAAAAQTRAGASASDLIGDLAGSSAGSRAWADTRTTRSPCLPSCHFNVRSRKAAVPRNTRDVVVPPEDSFAYCPDWMRSATIRLDNPWIMDGTGQGAIAKSRLTAKLERKRAAEARMQQSVQLREARVESQDAARIHGIARVRHDWIASMQGIWA